MSFMRNPFSKTYTTEEIQQFLFLRNFELFERLTDKELSLFLPYIHERIYGKDEVIFFRNDPSHALYLIKKGKVILDIDINEKFETLGRLGPYTMLGENCILGNTKRPMNARVLTETASLSVIPKDNILNIFDAHPEVKLKIFESFSSIAEGYLKKVFKHYRNSFGLFNLSDVFKN